MAPIAIITPILLAASGSNQTLGKGYLIAFIVCAGGIILLFGGVFLVGDIIDCYRARRSKRRARKDPAPAGTLCETRSWPGWKSTSKKKNKATGRPKPAMTTTTTMTTTSSLWGGDGERTSQMQNATRGGWPSPSSERSPSMYHDAGTDSIWSERYAANPSTTVISSIPLYAWETPPPYGREEEEGSITSSPGRTEIGRSNSENSRGGDKKRVDRTTPVEESKENIFVAFAGFLRSWAMVEGRGRN